MNTIILKEPRPGGKILISNPEDVTITTIPSAPFWSEGRWYHYEWVAIPQGLDIVFMSVEYEDA